MSSGNGVIPNEIINKFDSLDISHEEGNFFLPHHFYSSLKEAIITTDDYNSVKKLHQTKILENLGELSKLYNFQGTIIFCKIFENQSHQLQKLFKYNHKKCNSASSFSGCVHKDKSKCLIAVPTEAGHVKLFEKTLIGGFGCVNTRLTFDSQILLPKDKANDYKLILDLKINNIKEKKRITTKILKMDENNQYGQALTKLLPYGCIKRMKTPSLLEFNCILSSVSHEDKIGHLFVVNIKFHDKNPKTILFNEIYTPIFEKNKIVLAHERSTFQLMSVLSRNDEKDISNNFKCTVKTH